VTAGPPGTLLDTSVLIASDEEGRLDLPPRAAISVMTLGELRAGVLRAPSPEARSARAARLAAVRRAFLALDVDASVADHYGVALAHARQAGRTAKASDLLIIATASATGRELYTLDAAQAALAHELGLAVSGA
jgi:predicted nucleic acid-binding protein